MVVSPDVTITAVAPPVPLHDGSAGTIANAVAGLSALSVRTLSPNDILVVVIGYDLAFASVAPTSPGLTFVKIYSAALSPTVGSAMYGAVATTPGAYVIAAGNSGGGTTPVPMIAVAASGCNLSTPVDALAHANGTASIPSVTMTTASPDDLVIAFLVGTAAALPTLSPGAGYTLDVSMPSGPNYTADEYGAAANTGAHTVSFGTTMDSWFILAIALAPA